MDILHRVGMTATSEQVYGALTTIDGLAAWWTTDVNGGSQPGPKPAFRMDGPDHAATGCRLRSGTNRLPDGQRGQLPAGGPCGREEN